MSPGLGKCKYSWFHSVICWSCVFLLTWLFLLWLTWQLTEEKKQTNKTKIEAQRCTDIEPTYLHPPNCKKYLAYTYAYLCVFNTYVVGRYGPMRLWGEGWGRESSLSRWWWALPCSNSEPLWVPLHHLIQSLNLTAGGSSFLLAPPWLLELHCLALFAAVPQCWSTLHLALLLVDTLVP